MNICPTCGLKFDRTLTVCPNDGGLLEYIGDTAKTREHETLHGIFRTGKPLWIDATGTRHSGVLLQDGTPCLITIFPASERPSVTRDAVLDSTLALLEKPLHDNLLKLKAWDTQITPAYIIEEAPQGPSLSNILKQQGKMHWTQATPLILSVARALEWLDDRGVMHRALHSESIFVTNQEHAHVQVGAWAHGVLWYKKDPLRAAKQGDVVASPAFMAPELIDGASSDGRSMIYALGMLFHELVSHQPAFLCKGPVEILKAQQHPKPLKLSIASEDEECPEHIHNLFELMTHKTPEKRFQSLSALINALDSTLCDLDHSHTVTLMTQVEETRDLSDSTTRGVPPSSVEENPTGKGKRRRKRPRTKADQTPKTSSSQEKRKKRRRRKPAANIASEASEVSEAPSAEQKASPLHTDDTRIVINTDFVQEEMPHEETPQLTSEASSKDSPTHTATREPRKRKRTKETLAPQAQDRPRRRRRKRPRPNASEEDTIAQKTKTPSSTQSTPALERTPRKRKRTPQHKKQKNPDTKTKAQHMAPAQTALLDEQWFTTSTEDAWDQSVLEEHRNTHERKLRTVLIIAVTLLLGLVLALILYANFFYTEPDSNTKSMRDTIWRLA